MCPPSSLPDCDVILEKFLLVSNLHCAGGGVITPVGSPYWSQSQPFIFLFSPGGSSSLVTCHDSEEEIRKILWLPARKLDISILRVWCRPPLSHCHSWFAWQRIGTPDCAQLTSEMSDVTLGNSPVIKIILYGPLEALAVSQLISLPFLTRQTTGNCLHLQTVMWSDLPLPKHLK